MRRRPGLRWEGVLRVVTCALLAGVASACSVLAARDKAELAVVEPVDHRQRHPIAIREGEHTVELLVGSHFAGLNQRQRADVLAFAHTWKREGTGGIIIELPSGTSNARAARGALPEIRAILADGGAPPHAVRVQSYQPVDALAFAPVRLTYPKMTAHAGPCGLWPHDLGPTFDRRYNENEPYWNLGCATQRNIAAMVDNPADLVQPRGETPPLASRRSTVLNKYRQGESPATNYPVTRGTISDVGTQ